MSGGRRALLVLLLALAVAGTQALAAEDTTTGGTSSGHVAQPYQKDEFAPWMRDLWRAEAVFVGSFPFTLFLTFEVYDTWRYATNDFGVSYAPWPIGSSDVKTYEEGETLWLAVSALSASLAIAAVDFVIERIHESKKR